MRHYNLALNVLKILCGAAFVAVILIGSTTAFADDTAAWKVGKVAYVTVLGGGCVATQRSACPPGQSTIEILDRDGGKPHKLVSGTDPAWSPDGTQLAYCGGSWPKPEQIWVIHADGTGARQLTHYSTKACAPEWSPDGKEIAFTVENRVAVTDSRGTRTVELTRGTAPHWSPDGTHILFSRVRFVGGTPAAERCAYCNPPVRVVAPSRETSLWVISLAGKEERKIYTLTDDGAISFAATWLSSGDAVAFPVKKGHVVTIFSIHADGTGLNQIARVRADAMSLLKLSPDGKEIIAVEGRPGYGTVDLIDRDNPRGKSLAYGSHPGVIWAQ